MNKYSIVFLLLSNLGFSQNLVVNPSFEDTLTQAQWNNIGSYPTLPIYPWYQSIGSPDPWYVGSQPNFWCGAPMPYAGYGYQFPKTGGLCAGFFSSIFPYYYNAKECITGKLVSPLIANHSYLISFYLSLGGECHIAIDKIGAYLSVDSIDIDTANVFNMIPQIENASGNIITDTLNWTEISGYYIAQGGEKWITIGCFRPDSNLMFDSVPNWIQASAYYYLDDVSVVDCTSTAINENDLDNQISLYPNPVHNKFSIQLPVTLQLQQTLIFNSTGENVAEFRREKEIDVSDLPKGIYVVRIETSNGIVFKKMAKL